MGEAVEAKLSSIALVNVWLGEFPDYFAPWLVSANGNPTVDFFIFTNAKKIPEVPANVHIIGCTFDDVKKRIQEHFDFDICLDKMNKLCEYKPAYGEAFSDHLSAYDFWGYCDIDLIWGNIRKYVTEEILSKNERIFGRGHLTIMKNTPKVNSYYRTLTYPGALDYRKVYTSSEIYAFDEYAVHNGGGTSVIMPKNEVPMYENDDYGRVADPLRSYFRMKSIGRYYVEYDKGSLYLKRRGKVLKENLYYHYYERKKIGKLTGRFDWKKDDRFYYISPATFVDEAHFTGEWEPVRTIKYAIRLIGRRIYIILGEPEWKLIKRFLK